MKVSIDRKDRRNRLKGISESVRRGGLPTDPMEIARILGIADEFAAMGNGKGKRRRRPEIEEDGNFGEDVLGV